MKKNFWYRFLVLFISYAIVAGIVLGSTARAVEPWAFWTIFGIVIGLFVVLVVVVELLHWRNSKKEK